ncbi:MAG: hypothetical protein ACRDVW_04410 [Acidimicrobiales bacterium]
MRADLAGQKMGTDVAYAGAGAVAARCNGARGARRVTIDGEGVAAWIHAVATQVALVFHIEAGLVREIELIADPQVLSTMDIARVSVRSRGVDVNGPHDGASDGSPA